MAAATLAAAGAGAQMTAVEQAPDCPAHGVLLDAAALCGAPVATPTAAGPRRAPASRMRETPRTTVRAMPLLAMPEESPSLAMLAAPDAFAVRPAIRQQPAYDAFEP